MGHFDAFLQCFRMQALPPELQLLELPIHRVKPKIFQDMLPGSTTAIYGSPNGIGFQLREPVVIEDNLSAIGIWNATGDRSLAGPKGYLQVQATDRAATILIFGEGPWRAELDALTHATVIDFGILVNLSYNPAKGPMWHDGAIAAFGSYIIDPTAGRMIRARRNITFVNESFGGMPGFTSIPPGSCEGLDQAYSQQTLSAIVRGIEQCAFLQRQGR